MKNNNYSKNTTVNHGAESKTVVQAFLANVFTYMTAALGITGIVAYVFGTTPDLISLLFTLEGGYLIGVKLLGYIVMFAPFILVLIISSGFQRFSTSTLMVLFIVFSILMGMSLSTIMLRYTGESIFTTFLITGGTFGAMAVLGYTTKTDLTKFGSILMMGVIGLILASIVNMIWYSGIMDLVISGIGVLIFTGLTAYDVQKLKRIGNGTEYGTDTLNKLSILGALNLYLDFINLFLFLLRFMGNRK